MAAIAILGTALSAPAIACMCSNPDPAALEVHASEYDQVFSGWIIWSGRAIQPEPARLGPADAVALAPGYWIKSKVLVLHVWRGTPSTVTEIWTPVMTNCDSPPIPGFYFVALTKNEAGRSIARNSECDRPLRAFAADGRGSYVTGGIAVIVAVFGFASLALLWVWKAVRRRRRAAP